MTALVVLEAIAIGLLGLLVAGLLRSHAEILRRLRAMGVELDPSAPVASAPVAVQPRPGALPDVSGLSPSGDAVHFALDRPGERHLLLFLSSGCGTCGPWWDSLRQGAHHQVLPGVRVIAVARDADEESPALLAGLAPADVPVVMSSAAWDALRVPGSPYGVLVRDGRAVGEGRAGGWSQLASLVAQHLGDADRAKTGPERDRRADEELMAAGIHPGHPSLYPPPAK